VTSLSDALTNGGISLPGWLVGQAVQAYAARPNRGQIMHVICGKKNCDCRNTCTICMGKANAIMRLYESPNSGPGGPANMKAFCAGPNRASFTHVSGIAPAQYLLRPGWQPLSITRHVMWAARASSSTQVSDEALFFRPRTKVRLETGA
jgi:hypothetical protein